MKGLRKEMPAREAERGFVRRAFCTLGRQLARLGKALVQGGGVISLLRLVIVVELCMLGAGVVRRLEDSYDRAMEAAKMELAVLEARELAQETPREGSAGISAAAWEEPGDGQGDDVPELRARDVATIISEETGDVAMAAALIEGDAAGEDVPEPEPLSAEDDEDLDILIRQGVRAMTAGDMRLCILSLEQAAALSPNHPAMLYYYGLAYDKLLNPAKARDYYSRLFHMRDQAGKYFERASRRLTYGMEQPSAMRGKLSFGPHQVQHTYDAEQGEKVSIILPVLLAPGEELRPDDIYIDFQFFDMVNGRKIDFSRVKPRWTWANEKPTWDDWEEVLMVTYAVPAAESEDVENAGDVKYYGFTAKLYYKGEPLDCISTPSSLILHEQRLNSRRRGLNAPGLFPDDGLSPFTEEAVPFSQEYDQTTADYP